MQSHHVVGGSGGDSDGPRPPVAQISHDLRGLQLTLVIYTVIFVAKLAAYYASGVIVVLAEAMHSLSDILISAFLLIAARFARRQADETHMFGYGRAENVGALVAATLFVSFTSLQLYREAIPRLVEFKATSYENLPIAIAVIAASMMVAAVPLVALIVRKARGPQRRRNYSNSSTIRLASAPRCWAHCSWPGDTRSRIRSAPSSSPR